MRVIARRWALRHEPRVYGPQQARKLRNALTRDEGIPSAATLLQLFFCLKSRESKGWVRRVPFRTVQLSSVLCKAQAAAVIPAARVVLIIIEPKTSVAGPVNPWVN